MALLAEERHNAIVAEVNAKGSVRVKELAPRFGVTEDSIRKDLTLLEKRGLLKKTYGGAVRVRTQASDYLIADRMDQHLDDKRTIATKALGLVHDDDTVFLDISTSNVQLAKLLVESGRRITLVTNCLQVILAANGASSLKLISLGGEMSLRRDGFVGALTDEQLRRYNFDLAFMGVVGVDLENDRVATHVPMDGTTKELALSCSKRSYLMLETRKLREDGTYWYAYASDLTGAITERPLEGEDAKLAAALGIEWL